MAVLCPPVSKLKGEDATFDLCDPYTFTFQVFFVEMVCTCFFMSSVISLVHHTKGNTLTFDALTVAFALLGAIISSMGITGGCINPAVGFALPLFQHWALPMTTLDQDTRLLSWWVYILGPAAGGILAGLFQLWNGLMRDNFMDDEEEDNIK